MVDCDGRTFRDPLRSLPGLDIPALYPCDRRTGRVARGADGKGLQATVLEVVLDAGQFSVDGVTLGELERSWDRADPASPFGTRVVVGLGPPCSFTCPFDPGEAPQDLAATITTVEALVRKTPRGKARPTARTSLSFSALAHKWGPRGVSCRSVAPSLPSI